MAINLMIGAQSVYAETSFQSGYNHGCSDVNKPVPERYINTIGQEASHHTAEFMKGYHQGFRACGGSNAQDSSNFLDLKPGQHYGVCEEIGPNNELGCDVVNESDLPNGYKQGIADAKSGQIAGNEITNRTGEYMDGYIFGYCSMKPTTPHDIGGRNCSTPLYPGIG